MRTRPSLDQLVQGVTDGDRAALGQAITRMESTLPSDEEEAQQLLARLLPRTGRAVRVGITGSPGVGKSTFIEKLGLLLCARGERVAVLAVDPSSSVTGGSILGDKTRMADLARHERAFIRPSPAGRALGGVARRTRETMLLCEAAGFSVIIVETVGVGQSETAVDGMVDTFVALLLPGAGDELQGIKRGIMEMADVLVVNKADGDNVPRAELARRDYATALHFIQPRFPAWRPRVLTASALQGVHVDTTWDAVREHRRCMEDAGVFQARRADQQRAWLWSLVEEELVGAFRARPGMGEALVRAENDVVEGRLTAVQAARALLRRT